MPLNAKKGEWSVNKLGVAESMAEGTMTQGEIAKKFHIQDSTISRWKKEPEFLQKIDELTLALERHSLAGMLRRLDHQQDKTKIGKNEWLKIEEFKAKLQGFDKTKVEHSGTVELNPVVVYLPDNKRNESD